MMARALALNGAAKVYIVGRRKEILETAAKSVSTSNIIPLVADVTSKEALASIVSTITLEVGYINVVSTRRQVSLVKQFLASICYQQRWQVQLRAFLLASELYLDLKIIHQQPEHQF